MRESGSRPLSISATFRRSAKIFQGFQRPIQRGRNGCRTITGDPMLHHQPLDGREALFRAFHDIVPGSAVNMDVNQSGCQDGIAEVDNSRLKGNRHGISIAHGRMTPLSITRTASSICSIGVRSWRASRTVDKVRAPNSPGVRRLSVTMPQWVATFAEKVLLLSEVAQVGGRTG